MGWVASGPQPSCATQYPLPAGPHRWFHGKISGQEAVQQLQPPEDGLFLVRESARHPGDYVLCVSFGRDVIHYRVLHRDGHLTIDEAVCFCNLMDMVEVTCGKLLEQEGWQDGVGGSPGASFVSRTGVTSPGSPMGTTTAPHLPFCTLTIAMKTQSP